MNHTIRKNLFLPEQVTEFERGYLARLNRIGLWFFAAHIPVFVLIAAFNATTPMLALLLTSLVTLGPVIASKTFDNPRVLSMVYGFTAMMMGGLLVHFGQGPMQIEMHFYFFSLIAMLTVFGNPMVIVVASVTVAFHHLVVWLLLPSSVFNYDASIWVVLVHALFVVLESVACCFVARSFFDNVIGLEKIVQARTQEVAARNREMRLVLDNVNQGLMTIDKSGVISGEHSRIVEDWLGPVDDNTRFSEYVARHRPSFGAHFELAWSQVVEGMMPLELTIEQLPKYLHTAGKHFEVACKPLTEGEYFDHALVVVSDITADVQRKRLEGVQHDVLNVLQRIARDRPGTLEFFDEANGLVGVIEDANSTGASIRRATHTLKGNAMLFGVNTIASACHDLENRASFALEAPSAEERAELTELWRAICQSVDALIGSRTASKLEIDDEEYEQVLHALLRGEPHAQVAARMTNWRLEPTKKRLRRIAEQAESLARRLNKAPVSIEIEHDDLRLAPARWAPFWSAFVHVLRNAVDHGLEGADARRDAGKPEAGRLCLRTRIQADTFIVELADDGRGIDWQRIAQRALELGLPNTTHAELVDALFTDGLSTREEVSHISGRGVGMSAMKAACVELGGAVSVTSNPGHGTTFSFVFPAGAIAPEPQPLRAAS